MRRGSVAQRWAALGITVLLTAAGCGADVEDDEASGSEPEETAAAEPTGPVTVENCGEEVTYEKVPERAVSYDIGMTEMLLSLGLVDQMQGYVLNAVYELAIGSSDYQDELEGGIERLGDDRLSLETVLDSQADWVFAGHNHGFVESRGITPDILANSGVASYTLTETCANEGGGRGVMAPIDALFSDYRNLGEIFGVSDEAERVVEDIEADLEAAGEGAPDTPARVMLFDAWEDKPFLPGGNSIASLIVKSAGGENITDDLDESYASVGWETVVARDPEVIFVVDYDIPYEQKEAILHDTPSMQNVTAVKDGNIFRIEFGDIMAGPRVGSTALEVAEQLRSIGK